MSRNNASPAYQRQIARDESDARLRAMRESAGASTGQTRVLPSNIGSYDVPAIVGDVGYWVYCGAVCTYIVATDLYESATYDQFKNVAAQTGDLASAMGSSAVNTVGLAANTVVTVANVCTDAVVTPILEFSNSIQEELGASLYPTRLKNVIPNDHDCGANYTYTIPSEKEQYERENSPEHLLDLLKDVIPGNDKWGANYTSDVIESLETYELLKHFKVKNFAQFVARKIMEELKHDEGKDGKCGVNGIYKYKDLLSSQHYINKISKLKRGPLDIDTLKDEFKIKCKGDEALLNTIPSEKEKPPLSPAGTAYIAGIKERARTPKTTPKTTIFGVTFTCCVARDGKTR